MAFASLFTLLDDITAVLDDVAVMTKMAAKKTAGVVGDDLALHANQVTGVRADRELDVDTDPELLAGVVARIGDRVYDGSLRSRLREMRAQLLPN